MAITKDNSYDTYIASASQPFFVTFEYESEEDLSVTVNNVHVDFVLNEGKVEGFSFNEGDIVKIYRDTKPTQARTFQQEDLSAEEIENAFDKITMKLQDQDRKIGTSMRIAGEQIKKPLNMIPNSYVLVDENGEFAVSPINDHRGEKGDKGDKGDMPRHEYNSSLTQIRFENIDGSWGQWIDLEPLFNKYQAGIYADTTAYTELDPTTDIAYHIVDYGLVESNFLKINTYEKDLKKEISLYTPYVNYFWRRDDLPEGFIAKSVHGLTLQELVSGEVLSLELDVSLESIPGKEQVVLKYYGGSTPSPVIEIPCPSDGNWHNIKLDLPAVPEPGVQLLIMAGEDSFSSPYKVKARNIRINEKRYPLIDSCHSPGEYHLSTEKWSKTNGVFGFTISNFINESSATRRYIFKSTLGSLYIYVTPTELILSVNLIESRIPKPNDINGRYELVWGNGSTKLIKDNVSIIESATVLDVESYIIAGVNLPYMNAVLEGCLSNIYYSSQSKNGSIIDPSFTYLKNNTFRDNLGNFYPSKTYSKGRFEQSLYHGGTRATFKFDRESNTLLFLCSLVASAGGHSGDFILCKSIPYALCPSYDIEKVIKLTADGVSHNVNFKVDASRFGETKVTNVPTITGAYNATITASWNIDKDWD